MLRILPLALILCLIFGCRDQAAIAELEIFKARAEVEEQNKELVKLYIETINKGALEAFEEILSPDYVVYSPSGSVKPTSREELIENYRGALDAFSEFTWNIEDMIASQDKVICRISARGIYKGGVPGIPVEEKEFEFSMISIMRIENGKIVEEWQEDDQLGLARQLGMELKPKTEK
jgi:steroid delta-isomerase-like uncharacterized protein